MDHQTPEEVVGGLVGRMLGSVGYYFLLRRMGAPKYIAFIGMGVNQRLYEITHPIDDEATRQAIIELIQKHRS